MIDEIKDLIKMREGKEKLQAALADVNKAIMELEDAICNKALLEQGIKNIKTDGMTVSFSRKPKITIAGGVTTSLAKNSEEFFTICANNGVELPERRILTFTQPEITEAASQLPDSAIEQLSERRIVSVFMKPEVRIRK